MRPWRDHLEPDDPRRDRRRRPGRAGAASTAGTLLDVWPGGGPDGRPTCGRPWHEGRPVVDGRGVRGGHPASGRAACGPPDSRPGPGGVVDGLVGRRAGRPRRRARAGLVVVPANTAYSERELVHIVTDVRAVGRHRRPGRPGRWVPRGGSRVRSSVTGPELDLPDGDPGAARPGRPRRPGADLLHVGDHRRAQGRGPAPPEPAGRAPSRSTRAWRMGARRPAGALPADLPRPRLCVGVYGTLSAGALGGPAPRLRPRRGGRRRPPTSGPRCSSGSPPCTTAWWRSGRAGDLRPPPAVRVRLGTAARRAPRARPAAAIGSRGARALRHDRDPDEHLEPLRRGAAGRHGRLPAARGRGGHRRRRRGPACGDPTSSTATGSGPRPTPRRSATCGRRGRPVVRAPATSGADEDGYLVIRGRSKELIISGGFNVYPAEVEDVLAGHPRVAEVAVTGTPVGRVGRGGHGLGGGRRRRPVARRPAGLLPPAAWPPTSSPAWSGWSTRCPATPWARWCAAGSGDAAVARVAIVDRRSWPTAPPTGRRPAATPPASRRAARRSRLERRLLRSGVGRWPASTRSDGAPGPGRSSVGVVVFRPDVGTPPGGSATRSCSTEAARGSCSPHRRLVPPTGRSGTPSPWSAIGSG